MSTRTVIIWLAVALVLGGAALYVATRPSGGGAEGTPQGSVAAGERVTEIDPAHVRAIEVRPPEGGGSVQRLERSAADPGEWALTIGAEGTKWPLLPTRVRSILQIVAGLRAVAPADPAATVGDRATLVVFEMDDAAAPHTMALAERTLGGTGLVEYTPGGAGARPRRAMVDDGFLHVFRSPGPREWRSLSALPGAGPEMSRLRVEGQAGSAIALARTGGRWHVVEPVAAPANPGKVAQVIKALQDLTITDFLDSKRVEPALMRLEAPSARIRIETDVRTAAADAGAAPQVSTRTQELSLGGPSDSSGKNLYAAVRDGDQTRTFAVDAAGLATVLVTDPAAYIATTAAATLPADVGKVTLAAAGSAGAARKFKRSLNSWAELTAGTEAQLAEGDAQAVNEALTFLSKRDAAAVHTSVPDGYTPAGTVTLGSLAGAPLEEIEVGVLPGGSVALRTGKVYRTYGAEASPRLLREWLGASGVRAPEPVQPAGDVNK